MDVFFCIDFFLKRAEIERLQVFHAAVVFVQCVERSFRAGKALLALTKDLPSLPSKTRKAQALRCRSISRYYSVRTPGTWRYAHFVLTPKLSEIKSES